MTDPTEACAALVARGDPDRFLAAMAAPVALRGALMTLYAFNLELARAARVAREPMIARMRLQFWRDVIAGADRQRAPAHEVAAPLVALIVDRALPGFLFEAMIDAREADLERKPFDDEAALWVFLEATAGALMALAVRAAGGRDDAMARELGAAQGMANYLMAVPALLAAGREPLPETGHEAIEALATGGLIRLERALQRRPALARPARPALLAAWRARPILAQAASEPARVMEGRLGQSEFVRRGSLLVRALAGLGP